MRAARLKERSLRTLFRYKPAKAPNLGISIVYGDEPQKNQRSSEHLDLMTGRRLALHGVLIAFIARTGIAWVNVWVTVWVNVWVNNVCTPIRGPRAGETGAAASCLHPGDAR